MTEREREVYEAAAAAWEAGRSIRYQELVRMLQEERAESARLEDGWRRADEHIKRLRFELHHGGPPS